MKTLKLLLVILMTSLMSQQAFATVTITPPVKPEALNEDLVAGNNYYLYNVGCGKFMNQHQSNGYYAGWSDDAQAMRLDNSSDGYYAFWTGAHYIGDYYDNVSWQYTSDVNNTYAKFDLQKNDDGSYKLVYTHNFTCTIGYTGDSYINCTATGDNANWIIAPQTTDEEGLVYLYKLTLYNAIVSADAKGHPISYYENIYNNGSTEDIITAARELNAMEAFSEAAQSIVTACAWNDYPIQLYSEDFWKQDHFLMTRFGKKTYGQTKTLSANVVITEPSTLVFHAYSYDENFTRTLFPIDVYVDGELKYSYRGDFHRSRFFEQRESWGANSGVSTTGSRRFFTEIPDVGEHRIEVVFTNNIDDNNEHYIDFYQFGIEKTPLITVNVTEAGQLGYEINRAMESHPSYKDNPLRDFSDIRRLKISGKLNDTDFEKIKSMTSLFAIDLADTDVKVIKGSQFSRHNNSHLNFFHNVVLPKGLKKIEASAFLGSYIDDVDIPLSVDTLEHHAFADTYINKAIMPNVKYIGEYAFFNCPQLKEVKTEKLENIGWRAFPYDFNLEKVELGGNYRTLTTGTFYSNTSLKDLKISDSVVDIHDLVFYNCYNMNPFALPKTVKTIGEQAFYNSSVINTLHLPDNATFGPQTFRYSNVENVVVPAGYYSLPTSQMFANCDSLKSIKLYSPTKLTVAANFVEGLNKKSIQVFVPKHLYYTYKEDDYWMGFDIQTFSTTELDSIVIRQDLTLSQYDRFEGTHDLAIESGVKFGIQGVAGMELKNVTLSSDLNADSYSQITSGTDNITISGLTSERLYTKANKWYFLSLPFDCNLSQTVNEDGSQYAIRYYNGASRATAIDRNLYPYPESAHEYSGWLNENSDGNKQTFTYPDANKLLLRFSPKCKVQDGPYNDLIHIRDGNGNETTYDDRELADATVLIDGNTFDIWITSDGWGIQGYGYSIDYIYPDPEEGVNYKTWTNYDCTKDIIPTGTGFIFMTSKDSWTRFYSVDNDTKKRVLENSENEKNEFHYTLQKNPSEISANRGWNLVGNPFPNYYNYHKLSFTAPITLWNGTTYQALSLIDDNDKIALKPYQAFFVQCPESATEISFPVAGRQLSSEIKEEANARPMNMVNGSRQLVDLTLSGNGGSDRTRVVMNEEASAQYEMQCDAAKFMSMDNSVPQLYSLDASATKYSINERPYAEEGVKLGVYIPVAGEYTLALTRNRADKVMLLDNETGMTINIMEGEYTFEAEAGTYENRFVLIFENGATSIGHVNAQNDIMASDRIFTPEGIEVKQMLPGKTYIIRGKNGVRKVMLK